jgi:hypothetical protein
MIDVHLHTTAVALYAGTRGSCFSAGAYPSKVMDTNTVSVAHKKLSNDVTPKSGVGPDRAHTLPLLQECMPPHRRLSCGSITPEPSIRQWRLRRLSHI